MHTLHYIAVEADNKQQAFDKVVVSLSREDGYSPADWSDWHVVGGGRWSTNANKESENNLMGGYNDDPTDVLGFSEDKEKFQEAVNGIAKWKAEAVNRAIKTIDTDRFISDLVDYASEGGRTSNHFDGNKLMNIYAIKEAADMLMGQWIPDSGFYDLHEHIAETTYLKERLDKPEQASLQYLVPVDFHF
jgi:hypothetical protein